MAEQTKDPTITIGEQLTLIADQLFEIVQRNVAEQATDPNAIEMTTIANYHFAAVTGGLAHAIKYCAEQKVARLSPYVLFDVMMNAIKETLQALPPEAIFEDEKNLTLDIIHTTLTVGEKYMARSIKQKRQSKALH